MPARRKKRQKKRILLLGICFFFIIAVLLLARSLLANSRSYFTISEAMHNGDIKVSYVDLKDQQIVSVIIPKDTEVDLGMRRGVLRASSVKKLIDSENLNGQFLADTVAKTFHFPVDFWQVGNSSDLPILPWLRLKIMEIGGTNTSEIHLNETTYLVPDKLPDGEEGYRVRDSMPLSLQSLFTDPNISVEHVAIQITNKTGEGAYYLDDVVKTLEVLGVKVAPLANLEVENIECEVVSMNKALLYRISEVFNCTHRLAEPSAFDIEIILGKKFFERF